MTAAPPTTTDADVGEQIVLLARLGSERIALTAAQVRDTVASYLATGGHLPTPRQGDGSDPYHPLHVITEQWLWSNPTGWVLYADVVQLATYRAQALEWMRGYFGPGVSHLAH